MAAGVRWFPPSTVSRVGMSRRPAFDLAAFPAANTILTPTLDASSHYWICKNNATYYNSGTDALIDIRGSWHLQLGSTSGSDTNDPTFDDDGTYERLTFGANDYLLYNAATHGTGRVSVVVAMATSPPTNGRVWDMRTPANVGLGLFLSAGNTQIYNNGFVGPATANGSGAHMVAAHRTATGYGLQIGGTSNYTTESVRADDGKLLVVGGEYDFNPLGFNASIFGLAILDGDNWDAAQSTLAYDEILSLAAL